MKKRIELKPCPFCGGHPNLIYDSPAVLYAYDEVIEAQEDPEAYVQCSRCGVETHFAPVESVVDLWNTRTTEDCTGTFGGEK